MKKIIYTLLLTVLLCASHTIAQGDQPNPSIIKEELLSQDHKKFDCHSSSIIETAPGQFCVVWKGGYGRGRSNGGMTKGVGIWMTRFDGQNWSEPKKIVSNPDSVCWGPVLTKLPSGELLLFYRIGPNPRNVVAFLKRSTDNGLHWSAEEILTAGILGPVKGKPIVTDDGTLICGSSVEVGEPSDKFKATACWIEISKDGGRQWKKFGPLEIPGQKFGAIDPVLFYSNAAKQIRLLCRDRANKVGGTGYIWTATSDDGGMTWTALEKTTLPNPDISVEAVDLGAQNILLVYNNSHVNRYPLSIALSKDGGATWAPSIVLETDSGEVPAAILASDGRVHITYAWRAADDDSPRRIKHVIIDPALLPR